MEQQQSYDLIIGLGKSGLSMARFLHAQGRQVIVTDIDPSRKKVAQSLEALGIKIEVGFHDQTTFDQADRLIPSPGIPITIPYIKAAIKKGVPVASELDIFYQHNQLPVIAITGTNGKTTTTTLLGEMLTNCGYKPFVCGNIGTPLVDLLIENKGYDIVVAEISSFQMDISTRFRPDVGILLNISEDHLDRYESYQAYETAKWRLFKYQTKNDVAVINQAIDNFDIHSRQLSASMLGFSSIKNNFKCQAIVSDTHIDICTKKFTKHVKTALFKGLPGIHNHENIAAALLAGISVDADLNRMEMALEHFKNLEHRIEFIKSINDIRFYNDSKATNTDAVIRAIQSFSKNIILILGGREKGTDFTQLLGEVKRSVKTIIALGETKTKIKDVFGTICLTVEVETMEQAVQAAFSSAKSNDIVLLSPACASFDMYDNYGQRGIDFANQVRKLEDI